jgi:hypothetical protein
MKRAAPVSKIHQAAVRPQGGNDTLDTTIMDGGGTEWHWGVHKTEGWILPSQRW